MGRKTLYNAKIVTEIRSVIQTGGTHYDAYTYTGIDKSTFYAWIKETPKILWECKCGLSDKKIENICSKCDEKREKINYFSDIIEKSAVAGKLFHLRKIQKSDNPKSSQWFLARKHRDEYGDHVEISGNIGISMKDGLKKVDDHLKSHPEEEKKMLKELEDKEND